MEEMADQQFKQMLLAYMLLLLKDRALKVGGEACERGHGAVSGGQGMALTGSKEHAEAVC
jgi:hypothetical protein